MPSMRSDQSVNFQITVFWDRVPCILVEGCQTTRRHILEIHTANVRCYESLKLIKYFFLSRLRPLRHLATGSVCTAANCKRTDARLIVRLLKEAVVASGPEPNYEKPVRIADVLIEIRTQYLPSTIL